MSERRPTINPEDIQFSPDKYEVLNGLVDIRGNRVGTSLVTKVISGEDLIFLGQPGAGKTTVLNQTEAAVDEVIKSHQIEVPRSVVSYEDIFRKVGVDNEQLNKELLKAFLSHPDESVLGEIPGVGRIKPKDRGVTAFKELARQTDRQRHFVYMVAHPISQRNAGRTRTAIRHTAPKDVVRVLQEEHNVIVSSPDTDDPLILGWELKDRFDVDAMENAVANEGHITVIRSEIQGQIFEWEAANSQLVPDRIREVRRLLPESYIPSRIREIMSGAYTEEERESVTVYLDTEASVQSDLAVSEAAFAEYTLKDELGLKDESYSIVFSPPQLGLIHWIIRGRKFVEVNP